MRKLIICIFMVLGGYLFSFAQHPSLLFTQEEVNEMRAGKGTVPAFDKSLSEVLAAADAAVNSPVSVPVPVDGGGGVVHEQHKSNYYAMFHCGVAYQLTGDKKYAAYVGDMLEAYAKLYPTLGFHPLLLSPVPGRLFWQTLNESVWLVHTAVAYDCIYNTLSPKQRATIEKNLFVPMADFIMDGMGDNHANNKTFNKMHNHATWATAAVGMIGFAMNREDYVKKALYGSDGTGKRGGFIRQMDYLFSPDGYFTEGAYYQRYAIWPFVIFAQCIENKLPDLKIFNYRDSILSKALSTLIQLSYEGEFFHINDALLKGLSAQELVYAVDILYNVNPSDKSLLSVANKYQHTYLPTSGGFKVARDIARGEAAPIIYRSSVFRDGRKGDEGGVAVIRSTDSNLNSALTLKATSHGLSHGHFDKLTMAYYDNGNEILPDYGASRFLNIEAKYKGHYTRENQSFAKQTIAHNTLVVDETSHFAGDIKVSSRYHSDIIYHDFNDGHFQVMVAKDTNAYPGIEMKRTLAYVTTPFLQFPLILDVLQANADKEHQYDYPIWYNGHFVSLNFPYAKATNELKTLGTKDGYQHLWLEAWGQNKSRNTSSFTFVNKDRFYTISIATTAQTEMKMLRLGANDPDFNLRNETAFLIREKARKNHTFATSIETHGEYDVVMETSSNLTSSCEEVKVVMDTASYTVVKATYKGGHSVMLCLSNTDADKEKGHRLTVEGTMYAWNGRCGVFMK